MPISNTTSTVTVRTKVAITEVRIAKTPDDTPIWQAPVVTTITKDSDGTVLGQSAEQFQVDHPAMVARIPGLNAQLAAILAALEEEWKAQNP